MLRVLVDEEDIAKLAFYQGEPFAWAWLANEGHPAYMGHVMMAEMMGALLTQQHRITRRSPAACLPRPTQSWLTDKTIASSMLT